MPQCYTQDPLSLAPWRNPKGTNCTRFYSRYGHFETQFSVAVDNDSRDGEAETQDSAKSIIEEQKYTPFMDTAVHKPGLKVGVYFSFITFQVLNECLA